MHVKTRYDDFGSGGGPNWWTYDPLAINLSSKHSTDPTRQVVDDDTYAKTRFSLYRSAFTQYMPKRNEELQCLNQFLGNTEVVRRDLLHPLAVVKAVFASVERTLAYIPESEHVILVQTVLDKLFPLGAAIYRRGSLWDKLFRQGIEDSLGRLDDLAHEAFSRKLTRMLPAPLELDKIKAETEMKNTIPLSAPEKKRLLAHARHTCETAIVLTHLTKDANPKIALKSPHGQFFLAGYAHQLVGAFVGFTVTQIFKGCPPQSGCFPFENENMDRAKTAFEPYRQAAETVFDHDTYQTLMTQYYARMAVAQYNFEDSPNSPTQDSFNCILEANEAANQNLYNLFYFGGI